MHIVTGGAGFIGSAMVWKLNQVGIDNIWIVDQLGTDAKWKNIQNLKFEEILDPDEFMELSGNGSFPENVESIIHLGACSTTTERDADYLLNNNYEYSRTMAQLASGLGTRLLAASSGAVYGGGEQGYGDGCDNLDALRPLNMYGHSKLMFDQWAVKTGMIDRLASLRFFNVYGPNEYHKGDMASMVFKSFRQVRDHGCLKLFRSYRPEYADGEQLRDFVYVKDIVDVMWWLVEHPNVNGIFNLGTGVEESWNQLAAAVFAVFGKEPVIDYIDMPESIRDQYQYWTRADITRIREAGYGGRFRSVADGVRDYIINHLMKDNPYISNGNPG